MRRPAGVVSLLSALALVGTVVLSGATPANAADPVASPQVFAADGANHGVVVYWQPPSSLYDSFTTTLYDAADTTFSTPLVPPKLDDPAGSPSTDYGGYGAEFFGLTAGQRIRATVVAHFQGVSSEPAVTDVMQVYAPIAQVTRLVVRSRDHALTLSWTRPSATALTGPLTAYRVVAQEAGAGYQEMAPGFAWLPPTATSVTLRGQYEPLVNGRPYTVEVVPIAGDEKRFWPNNQFRRDFPLASRATAAPFGPAAKPAKLRYVWRWHGRATLTWTRSRASAGRPVDGYRVYVNGTRVRTLDGRDATRYTVRKLTQGKRYTFKVAAINDAGPGPRASTGRHRRP